ncbi:MAG: hypothetical protein ABL874_10610 [Sphingopyxis sp.]
MTDEPIGAGELPEPPWMARVQRAGWALMLLSLGAMVIARLGPLAVHVVAVVVAFVSGPLGLLAIVNIALIRALYKRVDAAGKPPLS